MEMFREASLGLVLIILPRADISAASVVTQRRKLSLVVKPGIWHFSLGFVPFPGSSAFRRSDLSGIQELIERKCSYCLQPCSIDGLFRLHQGISGFGCVINLRQMLR